MVMDSEQKFTEVKETYEIDDWFYSQLGNYNRHKQTNIIGQFLSVIRMLPSEEVWTQETAGVIKGKEPFFFVVEYLKEQNQITILVDLHEIEVDEYLDFISNKKSIKSYHDGTENRNANEESSRVQLFKEDN